jgi:hypothetical protein
VLERVKNIEFKEKRKVLSIHIALAYYLLVVVLAEKIEEKSNTYCLPALL